MSPFDGDDGNRGEARLRDYLAELSEDPPEPDPHLTGQVTRRARWQHAARGPLQTIGLLLGAVADSLSDLLGADRGVATMTALPSAAVLDEAGKEVGAFIPHLIGALALLVVGLLLAKLIGRILRKALEAADLDDASAKLGIDRHLSQAGLPSSLSTVLGSTARIALSLVVIFAALSLLGLRFLSESLNAGVLLIPSVLLAAALVLAGLVLGGIARQRVERLTFQLDLPVSLGQMTQVLVVSIFAITAAAQIAVSTAILLVLVAILLAGAVSMLAIAFGLGGQSVARELSTGRHARNAFKAGDEIAVEGIRGRIVAVESMATVIETGEEEQVRVPNRFLLESMVTVYRSRPDTAGEAQGDRPEGDPDE